tara:strand:- start:65285 stop:66067 length:783 start_codon:yes stop_codon:yes gene_type:complete
LRLRKGYQIITTLSILLLTLTTFAQSYNSEVVAKINMDNQYNLLKITGTAYNQTPISQSFRYELSVIKGEKGSGNKSRSSQDGRIVLASGETKQLSTTTINKDDTRVIILLLIYDLQDNLIGKDRIVLNGNEEEEAQQIIINKAEEKKSQDIATAGEDGVILRGIVVEDTKTKLGSDFYKMFYSSYLLNKINGKEIVTIKEDLAIGRNTKIEIFVADDIVLEFVLRPQNDFLEAAKEEAIIRVRQRLKKLESDKTMVKSY